MTKTQQIAFDAIRTNGYASSVWVSRAAGRVFYAGETKLTNKAIAALRAAGVVRFKRDNAGVIVRVLPVA